MGKRGDGDEGERKHLGYVTCQVKYLHMALIHRDNKKKNKNKKHEQVLHSSCLMSSFFFSLQVMLIAKSYFGKGDLLQQGVKRLSEGKYRIAGRIVFVRVSAYFLLSFLFVPPKLSPHELLREVI